MTDMKESRITNHQIVGVLRQAEADVAVKQLRRKPGVSLTQGANDLLLSESHLLRPTCSDG
jgi:hypothetical protein